jgi:hypothetical protein
MRALLFIGAIISISGAMFAGPKPDEPDPKAIEEHVEEGLRQKAPRTDGLLVIPTAEVAVAIHEAVAGAVFGKDAIEQQSPARAVRSGEFWVVFGILPPDTFGWAATTVIRASDGKVIWITAK